MRLSYIINAISLILIYVGILIFLPVFVALLYREHSAIIPFLAASIISCSVGFCLKIFINFFLKKDNMTDLKKSEGLTVVLLAWVLFAIVATIPYTFFDLSLIDAFFEAISGITTTGATIFVHYNYPNALFFWRALTQWVGGMGIIILFIAILPQFSIAGRQMFFAEAPGPTEDKLTPRIKNTAVALWSLYILLTILEIVLLTSFKMPLFEAVCTSFSTISSGGFSLGAESMQSCSIGICWILIAFMFLSGCNLALVYRVISQFKYKLIYKNEEFKSYISIIIIVSLLVFLSLSLKFTQFNFKNFTDCVFTVISLMTSTGYISCDYSKWSVSAQILLLIAIFFGSSAGSTGGGIKITRALIIFKYLKRELVKLLHPNAVITIKTDNVTVPPDIISQIIAFVMFYITIFLISSILVSIVENNAIIGFTGTMATLSIIGPGFGHVIGPVGNFSSLNEITKIIFMFNMLIGRLELVPFLVLLNKDYWVFKK